jgi:hypothetical protein
MLLQFTVQADDSIWIVDTQFLNWARVSAPGTDPISTVLESGKLIPQGFGVYAFEGRTPETEGPGAGICSVGTYLVGLGNTIKIYIRTNVPIKDFTMPAPIRQILYEILPTDPKQIESSIQEIANGQAAESSGPQEPQISRELPETATRTEQPEAETSVEFPSENLGESVDTGGES